MDRVSKEVRSRIMSRIRSKNTGLERVVFAFLRKRGIHFQRHYGRVPGSPDIAVPSRKLAVFVDGGFWHGWRFRKIEKRLPKFWRDKIAGNIRRDRRTRQQLKVLGWRTLRVWDHQLKRNPERWLGVIETFLVR